MPYSIENFQRDYAKEHFKDLTPQERLEALKELPPEQREEIEQALQRLTAEESSKPRKKPRRR